jgi:hypothetical protein
VGGEEWVGNDCRLGVRDGLRPARDGRAAAEAAWADGASSHSGVARGGCRSASELRPSPPRGAAVWRPHAVETSRMAWRKAARLQASSRAGKERRSESKLDSRRRRSLGSRGLSQRMPEKSQLPATLTSSSTRLPQACCNFYTHDGRLHLDCDGTG